MLEVRKISKAFGGVHALSNVSFSVAAGELLAMIGPNGAGKTTCFNLLDGQLAPDSGAIELDGKSLLGKAPHMICRAGVGRTFQVAAAFDSMTARENVQVALLSHARRLASLFTSLDQANSKKAIDLLARVGMADQADRQCAELAYGDLKRVELAVALATDPRLLLMDEPTAGMATAERHALIGLVAELVREQGMSVLFTEHDMDIVFGNADRIVVLAEGELIAAGTAAEIRADARVRRVYLGEDTLDA